MALTGVPHGTPILGETHAAHLLEEAHGGQILTQASDATLGLVPGQMLHQAPAIEQTSAGATEEEQDAIDITINNVVCSFSTRCHLNLRKIAMEGMHVILRKECGMLSMKLRRPKATASIWSSGKITCTGSVGEVESKIAAKRIARRIQKLGFSRVRFCNFRVVNVLGTCSLPFGIKINSFSKEHPRQASYEPELHPGVTFRIVHPKATLKIFSTGSITVTAPRVLNVQTAIEYIYPLVFPFRMHVKELDPKEVIQTQVYLLPSKVEKENDTVTKNVAKPPPTKKFKRRFQDGNNSPEEDWSDSSEDFDSDSSKD